MTAGRKRAGAAAPGPGGFAPEELETAPELVADTDGPSLDLVEGMVRTPGATLLVAPPKQGKTTLAFMLANAVASGSDLLGMPTRQGGVLYVNAEMSEADCRAVAHDAIDEPSEHLRFVSCGGARVDTGLLEKMGSYHNEHPGTALYVVDTLLAVSPADDGRRVTNVVQHEYATMKSFSDFAHERGCAVLVVHHTGKGADETMSPSRVVSGTYGLAGAADAIVALLPMRKGGGTLLKLEGRGGLGHREAVLEMRDGRWEVVEGLRGRAGRVRTPKAYVVAAADYVASLGGRWQGSMAELIAQAGIEGATEAALGAGLSRGAAWMAEARGLAYARDHRRTGNVSRFEPLADAGGARPPARPGAGAGNAAPGPQG